MRIHNDLKPEICAASESGRYSIQDTYLDGNKVIATDGRRLTVIPVMLERQDVNGLVPVDAFKDARALAKKTGRRGFTQYGMECNGAIKLDNGATMPRPIDGVFPKWKSVVPKKAPVMTIALNAFFLAEIATAIGKGKGTEKEGEVHIDISDPSEPFVIHNGDRFAAGAAFAVLMPVNISETNPGKTPDYYAAELNRVETEDWEAAIAEYVRAEFDGMTKAQKSARVESDFVQAIQMQWDKWSKLYSTSKRDRAEAMELQAKIEARDAVFAAPAPAAPVARPKTRAEFEAFIKVHTVSGLTPRELKRFDALITANIILKPLPAPAPSDRIAITSGAIAF